VRGQTARAHTFENILKQIYQGNPVGEDLLKQKVANIVQRYPPAEYSIEGSWNDSVVSQITHAVWESLIKRGLDRFWFLSGSGERRIKTSAHNFVFNVMLSNAPPEQRAFYNQVVVQFRKDKRLAKKKISKSTFYMGHDTWLTSPRALCSRQREELFRLWNDSIDWPKMANGKSIKASIRRDLFYLMLQVVDEWVLDADFYHNFRQLVNFPRPGSGFFSAPGDSDDDEDEEAWDDNSPTNFYKLFVSYFKANEDHEIVTRQLQNPEKAWKEGLQKILEGYNAGERGFLYYFCVENIQQSKAAKKAGRSVGFGSGTKQKFRTELAALNVSLSDLPAMHKYLSAWLYDSLNQEAAQ